MNGYSCILFAALFDWFIWAIKITSIEIMGMGMIIIGVILTVFLAPKAKSSS